MSIDSRIYSAVKSVVTECKPNIYKGSAEEYCVFTYTEIPVVHADSKPNAIRYVIQVDYYCPNGVNPGVKKLNLAQALFNAKFTYPSITNASDKEGQHYSFSCEGFEELNG